MYLEAYLVSIFVDILSKVGMRTLNRSSSNNDQENKTSRINNNADNGTFDNVLDDMKLVDEKCGEKVEKNGSNGIFEGEMDKLQFIDDQCLDNGYISTSL